MDNGHILLEPYESGLDGLFLTTFTDDKEEIEGVISGEGNRDFAELETILSGLIRTLEWEFQPYAVRYFIGDHPYKTGPIRLDSSLVTETVDYFVKQEDFEAAKEVLKKHYLADFKGYHQALISFGIPTEISVQGMKEEGDIRLIYKERAADFENDIMTLTHQKEVNELLSKIVTDLDYASIVKLMGYETKDIYASFLWEFPNTISKALISISDQKKSGEIYLLAMDNGHFDLAFYLADNNDINSQTVAQGLITYAAKLKESDTTYYYNIMLDGFKYHQVHKAIERAKQLKAFHSEAEIYFGVHDYITGFGRSKEVQDDRNAQKFMDDGIPFYLRKSDYKSAAILARRGEEHNLAVNHLAVDIAKLAILSEKYVILNLQTDIIIG